MIYPDNFEKKVGFDQIRTLLKEKCLSNLGEERVDAMAFSSRADMVEEQLEQVCEFVRVLQEEDGFPAQHFFDLRPALKRIRVVGLFLEEQELFDLRRSLETTRGIIQLLKAGTEEADGTLPTGTPTYPRLHRLARDTQAFPQVISHINSILNPYGQIKDNASPELARIRREQQATVGSISRILNGILRAAQSEGFVDKDVSPTIRDGRLVIPVIPSYKRHIKGIVHDESASGKTVFIEPAQVVEANNRIRELESEERREIVRILQEFTNRLRPQVPELLLTYEFLADIDFIRAKALWSVQSKAVKPQMEREAVIDWGAAIHPLLQMSLAKHGKKMVPLDIALTREKRILLISGPNAGGKSVCLKTVGLLQYMLQCGLPIPVYESSRAGVFGSLFIDIGDEQSIENDLSTYSSHLMNMKNMMKWCQPDSLILIDEFGGGTDPQMGGAIAEAVLKRLNERGTFGVITTHYQNLKHFAETHDTVVNGAMLYDRQLMQPLFMLQMGMPGSSFAVEIARKIGLPAEVIEEASQIVGSDYINSDKYIQDIMRDRRYWQNKRQNIHQKEKAVEELLARYQAEMESLQKERKQIIGEAKAQAGELIQGANAQIENTIKTIKEKQAEREETKKARQELIRFKQEMEEREAQEREDKIARKIEQLKGRQQRQRERKQQKGNAPSALPEQTATAQRGREDKEAIECGATVKIKGQQTVGRVIEVRGAEATVAFGSMKITVGISRLQPAKAAARSTELGTKATYVSEQTQDAVYEKKLNFRQDIDVRGMRANEAISAVTLFVDDAVLLGVSRVRILHGTGGGILRQFIRQYLESAPGVSGFRDEHVQFGGAGITVVDLA